LGGAGAGAPWDRFSDAQEHLMVPAPKDLGPRWPLAETREEEAEVGKGKDASAAAAVAELVAAMALGPREGVWWRVAAGPPPPLRRSPPTPPSPLPR